MRYLTIPEVRTAINTTPAPTQPEQLKRFTAFQLHTVQDLDFADTLPDNIYRELYIQNIFAGWGPGCCCITLGTGGQTAHGHGGGSTG